MWELRGTNVSSTQIKTYIRTYEAKVSSLSILHPVKEYNHKSILNSAPRSMIVYNYWNKVIPDFEGNPFDYNVSKNCPGTENGTELTRNWLRPKPKICILPTYLRICRGKYITLITKFKNAGDFWKHPVKW